MSNNQSIPFQEDNPFGLHRKYVVQKIIPNPKYNPNGNYRAQTDTFSTAPVDPDAEYFVLRLDHNATNKEHLKACRIAINAYADAISSVLPDLAADLKERYPLL